MIRDFLTLRVFGCVAVACGLLLGFPVAGVATDKDKLVGNAIRGAELIESCISCHGDDGMGFSDGIPRIVGQTDAYIRTQLRMFRHAARLRTGSPEERNGEELLHLKSAARSFSGMDEFVLNLSDKDIADLSAFYASLACKPTGKPLTAKPAIEARCESCHRQNGTKASKRAPSLASQHAIYIRRQLKFFRAAKSLKDIDLVAEGTTRFSRVMFTHSRRLTDDQINELAVFYESVPCK